MECNQEDHSHDLSGPGLSSVLRFGQVDSGYCTIRTTVGAGTHLSMNLPPDTKSIVLNDPALLVIVIYGASELLFASFAGAKKHPAWVSNLRANPAITVEVGDESFAARVVELAKAEAKITVQRQADASEQFAKYVESAAPRDIPVFRIERV